jgi:hypothetical protein
VTEFEYSSILPLMKQGRREQRPDSFSRARPGARVSLRGGGIVFSISQKQR